MSAVVAVRAASPFIVAVSYGVLYGVCWVGQFRGLIFIAWLFANTAKPSRSSTELGIDMFLRFTGIRKNQPAVLLDFHNDIIRPTFPLSNLLKWVTQHAETPVCWQHLEDTVEYWNYPVVAFFVRYEGRLFRVGGARAVTKALLTNRHVANVLGVALKLGAEVFVARCDRVVGNVEKMVPVSSVWAVTLSNFCRLLSYPTARKNVTIGIENGWQSRVLLASGHADLWFLQERGRRMAFLSYAWCHECRSCCAAKW